MERISYDSGSFTQQPGDDPGAISKANSRLQAEHEKVGIHEIDPELADKLGEMSYDELEKLAALIADLMDQKREENKKDSIN